MAFNLDINFSVLLTKKLLGTSLLRRLQAQTLTDEAPPIGKIQPFSKMTITFEPLMKF